MQNIRLETMTRELCHQFFQSFERDADTYMDMSKFSLYVYDEKLVDAYYDRQQTKYRKVFAIMKDEKVVGEVKLTNIDDQEKSCHLSIHLQNDSVKGLGIGTVAEKIIIDYAFIDLGMKTIYADVVIKNNRSQHVLDKLGFQLIDIDEHFKYYQLKKDKDSIPEQ